MTDCGDLAAFESSLRIRQVACMIDRSAHIAQDILRVMP